MWMLIVFWVACIKTLCSLHAHDCTNNIYVEPNKKRMFTILTMLIVSIHKFSDQKSESALEYTVI